MSVYIYHTTGYEVLYLFNDSHIQGIDMGTDIRIHKLHDPERGQTTLNFVTNN
jgi:hypothetical protein